MFEYFELEVKLAGRTGRTDLELRSCMSRKKGGSHVVDDAWRKRVEARLTERGWKRADLARESKVGRSTISDLLNGRINECVGLEKIHKALGWDAPLPPILSNDASELFGIWDRLTELDRGRVLERARSLFESHHIATAPTRKP